MLVAPSAPPPQDHLVVKIEPAEKMQVPDLKFEQKDKKLSQFEADGPPEQGVEVLPGDVELVAPLQPREGVDGEREGRILCWRKLYLSIIIEANFVRVHLPVLPRSRFAPGIASGPSSLNFLFLVKVSNSERWNGMAKAQSGKFPRQRQWLATSGYVY